MPPDLSQQEIENFLLVASNLVLTSGTLYYKLQDSKPRLFIPNSIRPLLFESFYTSPLGGGHMNFKKTIRKCLKYYWPKMHRDPALMTRSCITCQLRNSPATAHAEMLSVPANTLFAKIGLDLAGPFPITEKGNRHILNIICWFTKYVISVPLPDAKATTIAHALLTNCYLKFGGCTELISDNATAFTSEFFRSFCSKLSIRKINAIPYWSQGNSVTER